MTSLARSASPADLRRKGWVVAGALFLMLSIVITARNSLGLMMPFWRDELGWSYRFVSSAGAVMLTVMAFTAPMAGMVLDRFGPRVVYGAGMSLAGVALILCSAMTEPWHLVVLFGVMGGIGFAAISPSLVSSTVARYFDRRLGLATGVATSGSTAGQLALMPLLALLIGWFTWRPSYLVLGAAILATAVAVHLLIGPGANRARTAAGMGPTTIRATARVLARDRTFWLLAGGFSICGFTTAGVIKVHLIPYAIACGFPPLESASAYGVLSAFSLIGMIGFGHLSDRYHRPMLLAGVYFFRALTFLVLMHVAGNTPLLFTFAVLFGLFDYASFPIVASLCASQIGVHIMGVTMGLVFAAHSLGAAAGALTGGWLFELFARYDWVWIVSFGLALLAALLTILIREDRPPTGSPAAAEA